MIRSRHLGGAALLGGALLPFATLHAQQMSMPMTMPGMQMPAPAAAPQSSPAPVTGEPAAGATERIDIGTPVMDNRIYTHVLLDQLEDRSTGAGNRFHYDAQAWSGTDYNKLWLKAEGDVDRGRAEDGRYEFLYDHAISSYFDLQAGIRTDLDSGPGRTWAALGVQGLAIYFFDLEATAYASDAGHFAARFAASYDLLITQRLILQPEVELNLYSKADLGRGVGSGLSDLDSGLRLRYEITRKFAPYIGVAYEQRFGASGRYAREEGNPVHDLRFVFGVRAWF